MNWYCMCGSSEQGLQLTFDRFSAACDQEETKISSKRLRYYVCLSKAVFPASEHKYIAAGGDVQVHCDGIHE